jgi:hypothetical protein
VKLYLTRKLARTVRHRVGWGIPPLPFPSKRLRRFLVNIARERLAGTGGGGGVADGQDFPVGRSREDRLKSLMYLLALNPPVVTICTTC